MRGDGGIGVEPGIAAHPDIALRLRDGKTGFNFIPGTVEAIQCQVCPN